MTKSKLALAILAAGIFFSTACDNAKKTTAEAAIRDAQDEYARVAGQANLYVPEKAAEVRAAIQTAQDSFNDKKYSAAFEASRTLPVKLRELRDAADARKKELTSQWNDLSNSIPDLIAAIQTKADALTKRRRFPKPIAESFDSAKQTWEDAGSAFNAGKVQDALAKGSAAKAALTELEAKLKIKPAA